MAWPGQLSSQMGSTLQPFPFLYLFSCFSINKDEDNLADRPEVSHLNGKELLNREGKGKEQTQGQQSPHQLTKITNPTQDGSPEVGNTCVGPGTSLAFNARQHPMAGEGVQKVERASLSTYTLPSNKRMARSRNTNGTIGKGCAGGAPLPKTADVNFSRIVTKSLTNFLSTDASIRRED